MELVIKIPDKDYEYIKDVQLWVAGSRGGGKTINQNVINAIKNGTPLPKGHGDLIDRNALITELETDYHNSLSESGAHLFVEITNYIDDAEAVIPTDKESDNGIGNQD